MSALLIKFPTCRLTPPKPKAQFAVKLNIAAQRAEYCGAHSNLWQLCVTIKAFYDIFSGNKTYYDNFSS